MEENRAPMERVNPGEMVLKATDGGGDFVDYVKLDPGEPLRAHVVDIKRGEKLFQGVPQEKLFIYFEVDEGDGIGQRYRGDFNPSLTSPSSPKQSNLSKFIALTYGEAKTELDPTDLLGRPVRIILSEPWGDKQLQFVDNYLKPTPDQKILDVKTAADGLPEDDEVSKVDLDKIPF